MAAQINFLQLIHLRSAPLSCHSSCRRRSDEFFPAGNLAKNGRFHREAGDVRAALPRGQDRRLAQVLTPERAASIVAAVGTIMRRLGYDTMLASFCGRMWCRMAAAWNPNPLDHTNMIRHFDFFSCSR
jgi:hypothetical protein